MTAKLLPWPSDAIMIVAANDGEENRAVMEAVSHVACRVCGQPLAADTRTIRVADLSPLRNGRPVLFFCVPCSQMHDLSQTTHFVDHRSRPGADIERVTWFPADQRN